MELKNNQGIIFINDKTKDNQPDYRGEINVGGTHFRIALWKNKGKTGRHYFTAVITSGDGKPREQVKEEPKRDNFVDDEIPWK